MKGITYCRVSLAVDKSFIGFLGVPQHTRLSHAQKSKQRFVNCPWEAAAGYAIHLPPTQLDFSHFFLCPLHLYPDFPPRTETQCICFSFPFWKATTILWKVTMNGHTPDLRLNLKWHAYRNTGLGAWQRRQLAVSAMPLIHKREGQYGGMNMPLSHLFKKKGQCLVCSHGA